MNILIVNLHSALNLGDDAIMYATLPGIRKTFPGAEIYAAANDPVSWSKHQDIHIVGSFMTWIIDRQGGGWRPKKGLVFLYFFALAFSVLLFRLFSVKYLFGNQEQKRLLRAYYSADLVLSCGGGNFYSNKGLGLGFTWSLIMIGFAILLKKRVILLPQSIGPIPGKIQRLLARVTFNRVESIMVRDAESKELLQKIGVRRAVELYPDLVFSLYSRAANQGKSRRRPSAPFQVGVTVIDRGAQYKKFSIQADYEDMVVNTLDKLRSYYEFHTHIFAQCFGPTQDQDDRRVAERIYTRLRERTNEVSYHIAYRDALEIQQAYREMDLMIGSRMHTAILALVNNVPTVLIGYQPKALGMMRFFQMEKYVIPIEEVTEEQLQKCIMDVFENYEPLTTTIENKLVELHQQLAGWENNLK